MKLFFSIVIPAHNEEKYIARTLEYVTSQNYPKGRYEVIVVENGSNDKTFREAKKFMPAKIKLFSLKEGNVSKARNFGFTKTSRKCEWIVFLDADTHLKNNFLEELNSFLSKRTGKNYLIGTSSINPIKKTLKSRLWFGAYDSFRELFDVSLSIQIIKAKAFRKVKYDTHLKVAEDMKMIKQLKRFGSFFFLRTDNVETSTRRFERFGYTKVMLKWAYATLVPEYLKRDKPYEVIR